MLAALFIISLCPSNKAYASGKMVCPKHVYGCYKPGGYSSVTIYIDNAPKGKISSVKVSNKKVVELSSAYISEYKSTYTKKPKEGYKGYGNRSASIYLRVKKAGTTKVTYKIGGVTKTTTVHISKFTKPLTSLTITGAEGGANLANKINWNYSGNLELKNAISSNSVIKFKCKKGWKVTSVSFDCEGGMRKSYSNSKKGIKSYKLGKLEEGKNYSLNISLSDKHGVYESVYVRIQNVKDTPVVY